MTQQFTTADLEKLAVDVRAAINDLNHALTTKNAETEANLRQWFDRYEDENAKFVQAKQMRKMGLEVAAHPPVSPLARKSPEYRAFFAHITRDQCREIKKTQEWAPDDLDVKVLRTDAENQGGYLVPQMLDSQIRRNITELSPVRLFARTRLLHGKTLDIPRRLTIPTASWESEGETSPTDQSSYGTEQVTTYRQTVTIPATLDMMISSAFNLEQEIAMDVGESFGKSEGQAFISGLGIKGPQGITKDSRVETVDTATTGQIDFADLINVASKLKSGMRPWFYLNRRTLGMLQGLKSSIGVPIWAPVAGDKPATIWGYPYSSDFIDLADAQSGSGAVSIIFGDLQRGYEIFDTVGMSVVRDDVTRKRESITEWTFRRYATGRVIIPEAIKLLRIK